MHVPRGFQDSMGGRSQAEDHGRGLLGGDMSPGEKFPKLPSPPIVEAVIHWRAPAARAWEKKDLLDFLGKKLPDYSEVRDQYQFQIEGRLGADGSSAHSSQGIWAGFRLEKKKDGVHYVAQFLRDGLVFSRLKPYERWEPFVEEAKRAWKFFVEFGRPERILRLGVRFINRIPVDVEDLGRYLAFPPGKPKNIPLSIEGFFHRSTYRMESLPYRVHVVTALQPPLPQGERRHGLILDIDAFGGEYPVRGDGDSWENSLEELRVLKNEIFFSFLTEECIRDLSGGEP